MVYLYIAQYTLIKFHIVQLSNKVKNCKWQIMEIFIQKTTTETFEVDIYSMAKINAKCDFSYMKLFSLQPPPLLGGGGGQE